MIVVYGGLNCEDIIFDGRVESERRLNLLWHDVTRHYHVITSLTGAMAKRYVCRGCGKGCEIKETHKCEHACSDCMSVPPCSFSGTKIPCGKCNKTFRSQACFDKHKNNKLRGEAICQRKRDCVTCGGGIDPRVKHECLKKFCANCKEHRETGHLRYM
jgi:hypothetical protein